MFKKTKINISILLAFLGTFNLANAQLQDSTYSSGTPIDQFRSVDKPSQEPTAVVKGNGGAGCTTPWGGNVRNGNSVVAFAVDTALSCSSVAEVRNCTNGRLSGSYTNVGCSAPLPPPASLKTMTYKFNPGNDGQTGSISIYNQGSVSGNYSDWYCMQNGYKLLARRTPGGYQCYGLGGNGGGMPQKMYWINAGEARSTAVEANVYIRGSINSSKQIKARWNSYVTATYDYNGVKKYCDAAAYGGQCTRADAPASKVTYGSLSGDSSISGLQGTYTDGLQPSVSVYWSAQ